MPMYQEKNKSVQKYKLLLGSLWLIKKKKI